MRFILSAALTAVLAMTATAVTIDYYPNSVSCDDNSGGLQCGNIPALECCENGGGDIFSLRCTGLDTTGIPDICTIALGTNPNWCASNCNAGSGSSIICLDPGTCPAGTGGFWILGSRVVEREELPTQCTKSRKPDNAFFAGGQRRFRINYDVPANITEMLIDLVKTDPGLKNGAPDAILPYEIKETTQA